ncbi:GNAT family N-acetyltransferase [Acidobacteria bacterium AB60]|nr:GNAT family N-acetyltransferase [Acidobacteria bacterium AB60]
MPFADLALARRLERTEGFACTQFAAARRRAYPDSQSAWTESAGALLTFDGIEAPTTQSFGLGLFDELTPDLLAEAESFFFAHGSAAMHEICPLAGPTALALLCEHGYRPIEVSNVLYRPLAASHSAIDSGVNVRLIGSDESAVWTGVSTRAWTHEHPEFHDFMQQTGPLLVSREGSACFLAEIDGRPGAAGALFLHQGVALLAGAATVPELRRRGLQAALLQARLQFALDHGCDLAMMVAEAGSDSQRNAERQGFQLAYTRIKWRREVPSNQ